MLSHPFLVKMLAAVIYGDKQFPMYSDWTAEDKKNALSHLKAIMSFEFIFVVTSLQRSLLYFREASVKLQGSDQDIARGVALVEELCTELTK